MSIPSRRHRTPWDRVAAEADRLFGIQVDDRMLGRLKTHAGLIREWSGRLNLVSWRTEEELLFRHFLDCLAPLRLLPPGALLVADVGSGAGLPGIPMAAVQPDLRMVLVESRRRRASFLRHVVRSLDPGRIRVEETRAEELARRREREFDVVVGRAVRPAVVAAFAAVALRVGGTLILMGKAVERLPVPAGFETGREYVYDLPAGERHAVREFVRFT